MDEEALLISMGIDPSALTPISSNHLVDVKKMALALMKEHDLTDWSFKWDNAQRRAGLCSHSDKTISMSRPLMSKWTMEQARAVALHEIAHALVGPKHGHDTTWQLKAIQIGASPERCWGHDGEEKIEGSWTGTCPNGHTLKRFRKTKKMERSSCSRCSPRYDPRYKFTWTKN